MFANYLSYTGLLFWIKNSQNPIRKQQCNCFKGQPPPPKKKTENPKRLLLKPTLLLCPWDLSGKNPGVGCHLLLRGIILIQESNPELQADSLLLSHQEAFKHSYWFANKAVLVRRRGTASKSQEAGNFLVVQRLGLHTSMQGTRIWSLVGN